MGRMLRGRSWTEIRGWRSGEEWLVFKQKAKTKKSNEDRTIIYATVIASNHLLRTAWPWSDHVEVAREGSSVMAEMGVSVYAEVAPDEPKALPTIPPASACGAFSAPSSFV